MLLTIKRLIGADSDELNSDILDLISAARADLVLSGVSATKVADNGDPLIRRAITIYCQAHYDYDDKSSERLLKSYASLKSHLSLAADYKAVTA